MTDTLHLLEKHFDTAFAAPDGVKKLRELILTLAMQGKLVPQDPNDEPASELLKKIEAEKERSIQEGKLKKSQPLPEIKPEEIPYDLPEGWEWVRLGEITNYNGRIKVNDKINPETWLLDLEDIEKDTSRIIYRAKYSERQSKSTKSIFKKGDVLYGKLRPYLNKVIVADRDGICSTEIVPITPFLDIDSDFIKWCMKRPYFLFYINKIMYGVKMPRLGTEDALMSLHPLPPLAEQKRIVEKIDRLMTGCDELEQKRSLRDQKRITVHTAAINRLLNSPEDDGRAWQFIAQNFKELYSTKENITELRKAILQLGVMGKLVPQDPNDEPASELLKAIEVEKERLIQDGKIKKSKLLPEIQPEEIPYDVPEGWEWVRLGKLFKVTSGKNLPKDKMINGYFPVFGGNGITGYHNEFNVERPTIVIGRVGYYCGSIHLTPNKAWVTDNAFITNYDETRLDQNFVIWLLKTINLQADKSATAQPVISGTKIYTILVPLPPLAEQKRIVEKIDRLMALCDQLEQHLESATHQQTRLLQAVMAQV